MRKFIVMKKINIFTLIVFVLVTTAHAGAIFFATALSSTDSPPKLMMTVVDIEMIDMGALSDSNGMKQEMPSNKATPPSQVSHQASSHKKVESRKIQRNTPEPKTPQPQKEMAKEAIQTTQNSIRNDQVVARNAPSSTELPTGSTGKNRDSDEKVSMGSMEKGDTNQTGNNHLSAKTSGTNHSGGSGSSSTGSASASASISKGQVNRIAKQYPEDARLAEIEGVVWLEVVVNAHGRAKKVNVLSSPHRILSNAARMGAQNAVYRPALVAGRPVEAQLKFSIAYNLL